MAKALTDQEVALLRRKLDLLLRTGKLLVESAADTNRIVRNMNRVAAYLGLPEEKLHIDVSYTMLMVNVSDGSHSFSKFQKCEKHGINMTAISEISKLSWRAIENDYSLDQYEEELERIRSKKRNYFNKSTISFNFVLRTYILKQYSRSKYVLSSLSAATTQSLSSSRFGNQVSA